MASLRSMLSNVRHFRCINPFSRNHFLCSFIQGIKFYFAIITVFLQTFRQVFPSALILSILEPFFYFLDYPIQISYSQLAFLDFILLWCRTRSNSQLFNDLMLNVFCRNFWQRFFRSLCDRFIFLGGLALFCSLHLAEIFFK